MNQQPQQHQLPQQQQPQQPGVPGPQANSTMGVSDMRQQIIANALHLYPDVVNEHVIRFPNIPVRAEDIFDVSVRTITEKTQDGTSTTSCHARLTHAHDTVPAARMTLGGGPTGTTVESALQALLDRTCIALQHLWNLEVERKNFSRQETGPLAGMEWNEIANRNGTARALIASERAQEIDTEMARALRSADLLERDAAQDSMDAAPSSMSRAALFGT